MVVVAERDGAGGDAEIASFRLVVAEDVGTQGPFAAPGPRRPVVGRSMRRHEEGGDRVHEGGLAGADVAGEEVVAAVERQGPDPAVERAPVEDLQAVEAKARARLVPHEVEEKGFDLSLLHGRYLPLHPLPLPRCRRAPPGTRRAGHPARASHSASTNALRIRRTSNVVCPPRAAVPESVFMRRRNPRSVIRLRWVSMRSITLASLVLSGRNTRTISTISSRVSTRRVSPPLPPASSSASFLRSRARIRLTWKESGRRATRRGGRTPVSGSSSASGRERRKV